MNRSDEDDAPADAKATLPLPRVRIANERDAELARVAEELDEINRRIALIAAQVRWIQRAEVPPHG